MDEAPELGWEEEEEDKEEDEADVHVGAAILWYNQKSRCTTIATKANSSSVREHVSQCENNTQRAHTDKERN